MRKARSKRSLFHGRRRAGGQHSATRGMMWSLSDSRGYAETSCWDPTFAPLLTFTATELPELVSGRLYFNSNGTLTIDTPFEASPASAVTMTVGDAGDSDRLLQWPPAYRGVAIFEE